MNNFNSIKGSTIRYESELVNQFQALLEEDPDLRWEIPEQPRRDRPGQVEVILDERRYRFEAVFDLKPSLPWVEDLAGSSSKPILLITVNLSGRILQACREQGISAIDLNGRAWLRGDGLLVDRHSLPGRAFRYELEPRNIFVGKSERIVRCLLTDRDADWTQAEIVKRTQASSGLVSRIIQHLIREGFLEKTSARQFNLKDPLALLDEWASADRLSKRVQTTLYSGYIRSPIELAGQLQQWAQEAMVSLTCTQWIAAWIRQPYAEPANCTAYVSRLPDPATLEALGLRQVEAGGKLRLYIPEDKGVFLEARNLKGLSLVSDAQIYLDLQRTGLRGPDAAKALREWEGFCRI